MWCENTCKVAASQHTGEKLPRLVVKGQKPSEHASCAIAATASAKAALYSTGAVQPFRSPCSLKQNQSLC